ncbi:VirK protein [Legionella massiliensis]|uniref:VirK protein n=1 Tax=Legionella massiliensis TaxID=1034943 RepID=A0A078KST2_9GAMM|nr:VirK family protein [Legionella massiliensis]CDZ77480.1 VirK protein [Legionella massiliensis]CEE13218.1 VirK protein [Legionella massiliensis]
MLKKIIFPVLALFPLAIQAAELKTFPEVAQAVSAGKDLVFVVSLQDCDASLGNIRVSVKPNALMLIADKRVTASDRHFTLDEPGYSGTAVYDYAKFNINADGSAELHMTIMDAKDYHPFSSRKINCELAKGMKVFSLS